jgi:hypothetical protein
MSKPKVMMQLIALVSMKTLLLHGAKTKEAIYPRRETPSAFVHPVVGEGLSTLTDFVQKSCRDLGLWGSRQVNSSCISYVSPTAP